MSTRRQDLAPDMDADGGGQLPQGPTQPALLALLARNTPRSEYDPELAAATDIAMHPVTGAFADPLHESAFAAQLFRIAFPGHVFIMVLIIALLMIQEVLKTFSSTRTALPGSFLAWIMMLAVFTLGLVGRVLAHRMNNPVRGQRIGSWTWTAVLVLGCTIDTCGFWMAPPIACAQLAGATAILPFTYLATTLTNSTHGLGFVRKTVLICLVQVKCFSAIAVCSEAGLVPVFIAMIPLVIVAFILAHLAEMHLRHSYAEKERQTEEKGRYTSRLAREKQRLEEKLAEDTKRLEERVEQLRAEKERLMYDVQLPVRPLDDCDERSAIRRGLQAENNQSYRPADDGAGSSETGAPAPSDSPPPSLPPGPPSSTSAESCKDTTPPSAEPDAQHKVIAKSAAEPPGVPFSTAGPGEAGMSEASRQIPPPSAAESFAVWQHYAEKVAKLSSPGGTMALPLTSEGVDPRHLAAVAALNAAFGGSKSLAKHQERPRSKPEAAPLKKGVDAGKPARSRYMHEVPPLSWADADKQFYASETAAILAARNACTVSQQSEASSQLDLAAAEVMINMHGST